MSRSGEIISLVDASGKSRRGKREKSLASGGAGEVFSVQVEPDIVIKHYNLKTLNEGGSEYEAKILAMLKNVPSLKTNGDFIQLAWPLDIARDSVGTFLGFSMPMIDMSKTELLESMLQPMQAEKRNLRSDQGARMTVAAYLASVVNAIHKEGYHIVDLKPPNLRFYKSELYVTVLDCDGFDMKLSGGSFSAPQATPEYLAPEFHQKAISDPEAQDRFALAVIIFRLLNFGVHPYDGVPNGNNAPTDREGRISRRLYPYGMKSISAVSPLPVSAHHTFPEELRHYFDLAFSDSSSQRPSAQEWANILLKYAARKNALISKCKAGHLWLSGKPCGECHRNSILQAPSISAGGATKGGPVAFDLKRVWNNIQASTAPGMVHKTTLSEYAPTPAALPHSIKKTAVLIAIQRLMIWVLVPLNLWWLEVNGFLTLILGVPIVWSCLKEAGDSALAKRLDPLAQWIIRYQKILGFVIAGLAAINGVNLLVALSIAGIILYYPITERGLKFTWIPAALALGWLDAKMLFILAITIAWYAYPFGKRNLRREWVERKLQRQALQEKYDQLQAEWDQQGNESLFHEKYQHLEEQKLEYEALPETFNAHLNSVYEELQKNQLADLLQYTRIKPGMIFGLGPALIDQLNQYGIYSAADINHHSLADIPGFGETREALLIQWRDHLINSFSFDPAKALSPSEIAALKQPFNMRQKALEGRLQQGPQILNSSKTEIMDYRQHAIAPLCAAAEELSQALADDDLYPKVEEREIELGVNSLIEKCRTFYAKS